MEQCARRLVGSERRSHLEITPIGVILIVVGVFFFFARPDHLYWSAIFFVPFSSTAVVNVGGNGGYSGLQAWMFFGALWIASQAIDVVRSKHAWCKHKMRASVRRLVLFLFVALCSLVMPLWIDGRLSIYFQSPISNDAHPLVFSVQHVTQFLYLLFGVIFAIFVGVKNSRLNQFLKTLRIILFSSIFVSGWGLLQWFCYLRGLDYPAFLLNTNKNETAMGFSSELTDLGIPRISSVATEPSILAQYLLVALVLIAFVLLSRQVVISKIWDRIALGLTLVALLLTTSSAAYFGVAVLIPVLLFAFVRLGRLRPLHVVMFSVALAISCAVIYSRTSFVQDLADATIFSKADSFSALERINSVILAAGYFWQYPILGVGWGSVTSHDLVFKLLADTGIAGVLAFGLFLKSLGSGLWKPALGSRTPVDVPPSGYWASCMFVATLILILTCAVSEFTYVFGTLWLVFGMSLAALGQQVGYENPRVAMQQAQA